MPCSLERATAPAAEKSARSCDLAIEANDGARWSRSNAPRRGTTPVVLRPRSLGVRSAVQRLRFSRRGASCKCAMFIVLARIVRSLGFYPGAETSERDEQRDSRRARVAESARD